MTSVGERHARLLPVLPLLMLVLSAAEPVSCTDGESGTKFGLASFTVTGVDVFEESIGVTLTYDATKAGNPWSGGIFGYGEIERLDRCTAVAYFFKEREGAETLHRTAQEVEGMTEGFTNIYGVTDMLPAGHLSGISDEKGFHLFTDESPLSGSVRIEIEIPRTLFYAQNMGTYHVVVLADISYRAFNGAWSNFDASNIFTVDTGSQVTITIGGPQEFNWPDIFSFDLQAEGRNTDSISTVNWSFTYRSREGWAPAWTHTVSGRGGIYRSDSSWYQFALDHGEADPEEMSLEMKVVARAYLYTGSLMAESNTHHFYVNMPKLTVYTYGPGSVTSSDSQAEFRLSTQGNLSLATRVDWVIHHRDVNGQWQHLQTISQPYGDLVVPRSGDPGGPSLEQWLHLAKSNSPPPQGVMWMNISAKIYSQEDYEMASSRTHSFTVLPDKSGLSATIAGTDRITTVERSAAFSISVTGEGEDEVDKVNWTASYKDREGNWIQRESKSRSGLQDLVASEGGEPNLTAWRQLAVTQGTPREGEMVLEMRLIARAYSDGEVMATSNIHRFTVEAETEPEGRIIALDQEFPVRHIHLVFTGGGDEVHTSTGPDGSFEIPAQMMELDTYQLEIRLQYVYQQKTHFTMYYNFNPTPIKIILNMTGTRIEGMEQIDWTSEEAAASGKHLTPTLRIDDYFPESSRALSYIYIYLHLAEALEFYRDELDASFDCQPPLLVQVSTFDLKWPLQFIPGTTLGGSKVHGITIPHFSTQSTTPLRPKNREYHEFSHYAMYEIYGKFPEPTATYEVKEENHGGYLNPTTADSYVEGFAHFMAMVIAEHYDFWWNQEDYPSHGGMWGDLEVDYVPWLGTGYAEELAVASTLWDLYDGPTQHAGSQRVADLKKKQYQELLEDFDGNENGMLDGDEVAFYIAAQLADSRYHTTWKKLITSLAILYDADNDQTFDKKELGEMLRAEEIEPEDPSVFLEEWDSDKDGGLGLPELLVYLSGKTLDQLRAQARKSYTLQDAVDSIQLREDDQVDLTLKEIWKVLKQYHSDFTSVYQAFVSNHPEQKEEIDRVFISHGFFADRDKGNSEYDPGEPLRDGNGNQRYDQGEHYVDLATGGVRYDENETVGSAANWERPGRRSYQYLPGMFIKVDNNHTYYDLDIELYDHNSPTHPIPTWQYIVTSTNQNGYVYVPVPPEPYNATVTVQPKGTDTANPLVFTSSEFNQAYHQSVEKGYYIEHSFRPGGKEPGLDGSSWMDRDERDAEFPWFTEILPFLVPIARSLKDILPQSLTPMAPYFVLVILAATVAALVLAASAAAKRGHSRSEDEGRTQEHGEQ